MMEKPREKTPGELRHGQMLQRQKTKESGRASTSNLASPLDRLAERIGHRTKERDER